MNYQELEKEVQDKGADVAPRITQVDVEANIASEHYFTAADGKAGAVAYMRGAENLGMYPTGLPEKEVPLALLTFCVLVLKNGFTVTGESACASPENFNEEIGRRIARENAVAKVWPLLGYQLREQLFHAQHDTNAP